jgi:hypothetical protein
MARTLGQAGQGGMFRRQHADEPNSRMAVLSQDRAPAYLLTTMLVTIDPR